MNQKILDFPLILDHPNKWDYNLRKLIMIIKNMKLNYNISKNDDFFNFFIKQFQIITVTVKNKI